MNFSSKKSLPADERIWPLKPEVLLARGKCELQGKEEQAIRAAISEAITTYRETAVTMAENNLDDRKTIAALHMKSAEEAEEIMIRRCTYDRAKALKYRDKDAQEVSVNIDEEIAVLKNILNILSNKRKQQTKTLLDLQRLLASLEVAGDFGINEFPDETQRCRSIECQIEKIANKIVTANSIKEKYQQFVHALRLERLFYEARLRRLKEFIQKDLHDLETCNDIMTKGFILEQDSQNKLENQTTTYLTDKRDRKRDIDEIRKEVQKRQQEQPPRKKVTSTDVALTKMLQGQDIFAKIQERRKTLVVLESLQDTFEALQNITRATNVDGVIRQFENQADRYEYLNREQDLRQTQKEDQLEMLKDQQTRLSSIKHTGQQAKLALDNQLAGLESAVRLQTARREAAEQRLITMGNTLTSARTTVKQMLRALRFIPRPPDWQRPDGQLHTVGDLALVQHKMSQFQSQLEMLGAPIRLESKDSIQSGLLEAPKREYRIGRMGQEPLLGNEKGNVDDMQGMRSEMKNFSEGYVAKMTRNKPRH